MGTFHEDGDELHGLTVVVFSNGPRTYVGRWDKREGGFALIRDAGYHEEGISDQSRDEWLRQQKTYGVKVEHPYLTIPEAEITEVVMLRQVQLPEERKPA